jgi:ABC-type transport system involved in Fe-S cluster assembly fused permease/ATPase subunit
LERFRERLDINRELNVRNMIITSMLGRTTILITNFAQVSLLVIGGLIVIWSNGADLTAGGLFAFYALLLRLYAPAGIFAGAFQTLSLSADGMERVNRILERKVEEEPAEAVKLAPLKEALRFEDVGFAQVQGKNLLKDVSLAIPTGSTVAFVGPTGAGKATLMQLLPRLHDVTEGRITWDGVDLKQASRESVRAQVISLPQETFVLNMTIYDNIHLGRPSAPEQEVISAARTVGLYDFVQGLPGGFDTVVSDRDTTLSTPHRQRLAAARALLRTEASVLLIEDGLSAIEAAEQQEIERALRGPDGARTVIKITSRIGTITGADEIFVMEGGEVVEHGKHDDLVEGNGLYAQLTKDELGEAAVSGALQAVRRLGKVAPFSSLPAEVLEETAHLLLYAERDPGEVICRQGSHGDELYIIGRGDVEIVVADDEGHEQIVNVLGEGDYVGEISFLRRVPRTTTVRAQSKVELHILRRVDFDALLERLGAGTLDHMEETAQSRIEDTKQKLAALSGGAAG